MMMGPVFLACLMQHGVVGADAVRAAAACMDKVIEDLLGEDSDPGESR